MLALHLSAELEAEFRSQNESGPVVQYGPTMRGYSSVPTELLDYAEALREWYDRAWGVDRHLESQTDEDGGREGNEQGVGQSAKEELATQCGNRTSVKPHCGPIEASPDVTAPRHALSTPR